LSKRSGIAYAEPDWIQHASVMEASGDPQVSSVPNDAFFSSLYAMHNTGQTGGTADADIDAVETWDIATGSRSIVVGMIDTGVDYNHPDLAANIWTNPGEIAGNGIDDDQNGFVDDVHGYDFVNNDGDPFDDNSHGTHVSGTIGAIGNNSVGVAGVNWAVSIIGIKFLNATGSGSTTDAVRALNYATMMRRDYGVNIVLTNNSWSGGGFSSALRDAIQASGGQNMLFVAAAGNAGSNIDITPSYPASYDLDNIISVAATDHNDNFASFSNRGAVGVDLAAPGVAILSTIQNSAYSSVTGTSMATAHVSGVAALMWSENPTATYQTVRDALFAGVDPIESLNGVVATGGRLNALNAVSLVTDPEVFVLANGIEVPDGDATPSATDGTDFGSVIQGGAAVSRTFTVRNDGTSTLTLGNLAAPDGFTITDNLVSSLTSGMSDSFTIRFDSAVAGTKTGQVTFTSNDSDESPFDFTITGTVTASSPGPEAIVLGNGVEIASGDIIPTSTDGTDWGTVKRGSTPIVHTFSVRNAGDSVLELRSLKAPRGFAVTEGLASRLAPGESDTFSIRLNTGSNGTRFGLVRFKSNDTDESTYTFAVHGTVTRTGVLAANVQTTVSSQTAPPSQKPLTGGSPSRSVSSNMRIALSQTDDELLRNNTQQMSTKTASSDPQVTTIAVPGGNGPQLDEFFAGNGLEWFWSTAAEDRERQPGEIASI
jgi:subtilisin family serine protease